MNRRSYLRSLGGAGVLASTAGCLGGVIGDDGAENVALDPPEDRPAEVESSDLGYPAYGEQFPSFSLPDPIAEETVEIPLNDGRCLVCTAFYAFCPSECLLLLGALANVQQRTIDDGLADGVSFQAITFDPERDTADELDEHAEMMNLDLDSNWRFLRPENDDRAEEIVDEALGMPYERTGESDAYEFLHTTITFLVNPEGHVERAYRADAPDVDRVSGNIETVIDHYGNGD